MNKIKRLLYLKTIILLTLVSCVSVNPSIISSLTSSLSSTIFSSSQSESSAESLVSTSSSESSMSVSSSTSQSTSQVRPVLEAFYIKDRISFYTVGETYDHITDLFVELIMSDGERRDISNRHNYYNIKIFDSSNREISTKGPFAFAGLYELQIFYKNDPKIHSNRIQIEVKNRIDHQLTIKTNATSVFTYPDLAHSMNQNFTFSSQGKQYGLVIPVEINDFPFAEAGYGHNYLDAIDRLFNGQGPNETGYWESVSSYYEKSSFGNLKFEFEIAPVYDTKKSTLDLLTMYGSSADYFTSLAITKLAINDYIQKHGADATTKFDNDQDGYIDALWIVYSAPDYGSTSRYTGYSTASLFWAFATYSSDQLPNLITPSLHTYAWASISFMTNKVIPPAVDSHIFIHETGHLLNLPDYYSYDNKSAQTSGSQGGLAMMDLNIGDHDPFSKIALGWSQPYVVEEDAVITIQPNTTYGDAIIIADHWNGTAFDEYILLDLVVPEGINELDASTKYEEGWPKYFTKAGIRMLHVDARLIEYKYLYSGEDGVQSESLYPYKRSSQAEYYLPDDRVMSLLDQPQLLSYSKDKSVPFEERRSGYAVVNANSPTRALIQQEPYLSNRLLSLVSADGKNPKTNLNFATNESLFQQGDSWAINRRGLNFFTTPGRLHNGNEFKWIITILECNETSATIQVRRY